MAAVTSCANALYLSKKPHLDQLFTVEVSGHDVINEFLEQRKTNLLFM
jgi:hypothetical protein